LVRRPDDGPIGWPARLDLSNWGFFSAFSDGQCVGHAAVARDTPTLAMLEGRSDLALQSTPAGFVDYIEHVAHLEGDRNASVIVEDRDRFLATSVHIVNTVGRHSVRLTSALSRGALGPQIFRTMIRALSAPTHVSRPIDSIVSRLSLFPIER